MNISSGPSSIDFPQQDKYLKPCCTWQSSTKEKVSSILTENLKKVAHLKTCMNKEENLPPIKVSLAFKYLHKAPIPSILEVDESLSDNELYPEMRSISPPSTQATQSL